VKLYNNLGKKKITNNHLPFGIIHRPTAELIEIQSSERAMELIKEDSIKILLNPGIKSHQLISPENSSSERVTISRMRISPGIRNERHQHPASEQIWIALQGQGVLLLAENRTQTIEAGDVVRLAIAEVHGLWNNSEDVFEYLAVTTPPIDFRSVYQGEK
jgi:quercetin dioxygenase-like cupin family protein